MLYAVTRRRYSDLPRTISHIRPRPSFLRKSSTTNNPTRSPSKPLAPTEIDHFLAKPTWSVESLIPSASQIDSSTEITPKQLYHLLRLSALPPPSSPEEETKMLRELRAQLHFVKEVQKVDTTGVEPLRSIRDETQAAEKEEEIGLEEMRDALGKEVAVGRYHRRIRRRTPSLVEEKSREAEDWDALGQAPKRVGRFFVVEGR